MYIVQCVPSILLFHATWNLPGQKLSGNVLKILGIGPLKMVCPVEQVFFVWHIIFWLRSHLMSEATTS